MESDISEPYKLPTAGHNAVMVLRHAEAIGVLTKMDVTVYLSVRA